MQELEGRMDHDADNERNYNKKTESIVNDDFLNPETLMDSAGSWNRYQAFQTTCFVVVVMFFTYGHYLPILYLYTPEHHCYVPGGEEWNLTQGDLKNLFIPTTQQNESTYEKCVIYDVNVTEVLSQGVREPNTNWPISKCKNGWHYELDDFYNSVSTEFDFVCEHSWKGPFTETFYFIGSAIGMLLNGWIGDHFGRYWSIVICNISMIFCGIVLGFSPNYIFFTVVRFISGIFVISGTTSFFVIAMEYVSRDRRTYIGNFALGFGIFIGGLIMPALCYWLKDWRLVNHAMYAQGFLIFLLPFTTQESIRWLLEREKYEKASKVLEHVAWFNGKTLDKNIVANLNSLHPKSSNSAEKTDKEMTSTFALLKTKRLRRHFLIMLIVWSLTTVLFEGQLRGMRNLKVHVYYSLIISNFLEFVAGLLVIWTMEWFGRRWMSTISCLTCAIAMFVFAYLKVSTYSEIQLMTLSMFGRFTSSLAINIGMQFQFEICPTDLRSRGSGIILFSGSLSAFLAPYIIHSASLYIALPQIIMGLLALAIGLLALFLPETADEELPANAKEGEEFGRDQSFFLVPVMKNRKFCQ